MIPQKSNILYKELSETLNHNEFLIEEVIDFYYSEINEFIVPAGCLMYPYFGETRSIGWNYH